MNNTFYAPNDWWAITHSELYHHGIKGQHWGEKNGPPYPLNGKIHNAIVGLAAKKHKAKQKPQPKQKDLEREELELKIMEAQDKVAEILGYGAQGPQTKNKTVADLMRKSTDLAEKMFDDNVLGSNANDRQVANYLSKMMKSNAKNLSAKDLDDYARAMSLDLPISMWDIPNDGVSYNPKTKDMRYTPNANTQLDMLTDWADAGYISYIGGIPLDLMKRDFETRQRR